MPCWDSLLYTKASPRGNAKLQEESPEIKHLESRIHNLLRCFAAFAAEWRLDGHRFLWKIPSFLLGGKTIKLTIK